MVFGGGGPGRCGHIVIILFYSAVCEPQVHFIVEEVILTVHMGNIHLFSKFEVDTSTVCSLIGDPLCCVHVLVVGENIFNVLLVSSCGKFCSLLHVFKIVRVVFILAFTGNCVQGQNS